MDWTGKRKFENTGANYCGYGLVKVTKLGNISANYCGYGLVRITKLGNIGANYCGFAPILNCGLRLFRVVELINDGCGNFTERITEV